MAQPLNLDVFLRVPESLPVCDPDLFLYQVQARYELCYRVLHLDPGVHLHEIVVPLVIEEKLHRSGTRVVHGPGCRGSKRTYLLAQTRRQVGRGRFFQQLLVAALDGTFPLSKVYDVAVLIGEDLELDMASLGQILFEIDIGDTEGGLRFRLRQFHGGRKLLGGLTIRMPLPPPPAAALMINGIADLFRDRENGTDLALDLVSSRE